MYPLIQIETVPIEISMKVTKPSLEYTRGTAEMEISRTDNGGLNIKSRPVRVQMDSYQARNSVTPTTTRSIEQAAQAGRQTAYQATATYAQHGQLMVNAKVGENVTAEIAQEPINRDIRASGNVGLDFIPSEGPNIAWDEGDLEIRYQMDQMNLDWKIENGEFEFTPGDIEISVEQMPSIVVKYLGGPIYVPPSADPNYEPVDVKA